MDENNNDAGNRMVCGLAEKWPGIRSKYDKEQQTKITSKAEALFDGMDFGSDDERFMYLVGICTGAGVLGLVLSNDPIIGMLTQESTMAASLVLSAACFYVLNDLSWEDADAIDA